MRLIDADALIEAMNDYTDYKGYLVCDPEVIIDHAPTVERPHGEWKRLIIYHNKDTYSCSECIETYRMPIMYNFCPNCGADMRGGEP